MKRLVLSGAALAALWAGSALAQSSTVTTTPGGGVSGSVTVPGAPPVSVQAGQGVVTTTPPYPPETERSTSDSYAGPGRSVTVRSHDGSTSSSAWVSGGNGVVAGAGSPGSTVITSPPPQTYRAKPCPPKATAEYRARTKCRSATKGGS